MRIAVDFDDTIVNTMEQFCILANKYQPSHQPRTGIPSHQWTPEDFREWDASATTGLSESTVITLFANVDYTKVKKVPDSTRFIRYMMDDGHDIIVVTANPNEEDIREWMDQNGLDDVTLVSTPDKISYLRRSRIWVLIDDNPKTLEAAAASNILAVRMLRPWNREMYQWGSAQFERTAHNWSQVYGIIDRWHRWIDNATLYNYARVSEQKILDQIEPLTMTRAEAAWKIRMDEEELKEEMKMASSFKSEEWEKYITPAHPDYKPPEPVVTNERGGKQSDLGARFDLLPALAIQEIAAVLHRGAEKYGENNWHLLSVEEIHNHTLGHAVAFNRTNSLEDLAHTATRAVMALEIALREKEASNA